MSELDSAREYFREYVARLEPTWEEAAQRGVRLLDYLDAAAESADTSLPEEFRFPCMEELAFAGDSTGLTTWGEANDLLHPDAYLRVHTPGGTNRGRMQCVHFHACVKGKLWQVHAKHRVIVLLAAAKDFVVGETF